MSSWQIPGRLQRQQLHLHHQSRHQDLRNKVNNKKIKVQVWDTGNDKYYSLKIIWLKYSWGGQQRYRPNLASCYRECWLMASEVTELVSTGETWINFSASCSGFIFTTSLPPTVLAGSLTSVRLLRRKTTESQAPGQCQVSSPSFVKVRHQSVFFLRHPVHVNENVNISGDSGTLEMKELLRVKRTFPGSMTQQELTRNIPWLKATTRVKLCCSYICEILLFELWSPL